jgi:hypothetical protein
MKPTFGSCGITCLRRTLQLLIFIQQKGRRFKQQLAQSIELQ